MGQVLYEGTDQAGPFKDILVRSTIVRSTKDTWKHLDEWF